MGQERLFYFVLLSIEKDNAEYDSLQHIMIM